MTLLARCRRSFISWKAAASLLPLAAGLLLPGDHLLCLLPPGKEKALIRAGVLYKEA